LLERQKHLTDASWQSIYQQHPIIVGGGMFPIDKLRTVSTWDRQRKDAIRSVRFWDKAGTQDGGAHTAGVLMHKMRDGTFVIEHIVRGQWSALERERQIKEWSKQDAATLEQYEIGVEQEPGSGGKESAENTIRNLAGMRAYADRPTGQKEARAEPFAAQVQGGNVWLVAGQWHADFLEELESFPNGRYVDQVDACSGAFNRLTNTPGSTLNWGWMD
jgi:predicted phage terminase large subunit-like protein